jgi:hypothetical protein
MNEFESKAPVYGRQGPLSYPAIGFSHGAGTSKPAGQQFSSSPLDSETPCLPRGAFHLCLQALQCDPEVQI